MVTCGYHLVPPCRQALSAGSPYRQAASYGSLLISSPSSSTRAATSLAAGWDALLEGVRKNPRPFCMITQATPPCVVGKWFGANHHMFTPLLVADFHVCPKRSFLPDFLHPPFLLEAGFVLAAHLEM